MALKNDSAVEEKAKRVGLTFDPAEYERFLALVEFDGRKPATLAIEIIRDYMKKRAADIDSILQARADYQKKIEEIRKKKA